MTNAEHKLMVQMFAFQALQIKLLYKILEGKGTITTKDLNNPEFQSEEVRKSSSENVLQTYREKCRELGLDAEIKNL